MTAVLSARSIGDGVTRASLWSRRREDGRGVVCCVFPAGFYVRTGSSIFAVAGPPVPTGPIHLLTDTVPPLPPDRSAVRITKDGLATQSCTIGWSGAARYRPVRCSAGELGVAAGRLARLDDTVPDDLADVWSRVGMAVGRFDLHGARALLQGLGTGLTPTGDDALAGILLFSRLVDPRWSLPLRVALRADTTDLSRSFLAWAARGQSIEPVHALVAAAADDARAAEARFRQMATVVEAIGGTSGRAMLAGLRLAAAAWLAGGPPCLSGHAGGA